MTDDPIHPPAVPGGRLDLARCDEAPAVLRALLEDTADALFAVDTEGTIVFANGQASELFGYAPDELVGQSVDLLIPADARPGHATHIRRFMNRSEARLMGSGREFSALHADGSLIPVEIGLTPFEAAGKQLVMAAVRDIRNRRALEEAFQLSESRSDEVQRIAKIGNWDWNIPANELWWSDEIYRMFGAEPRSFGCTYEAFLAFVHPDDRSKVSDAVDLALSEKKPYSIRHRIVLKDGTQKVVHEKGEVVLAEDGSICRMVGTVQDVTDYKRIEEEVFRSEASLREAERLAKVGCWEWDITEGNEWWSDGLYAILETDRSSCRASFDDFLARVHPEDRERLVNGKNSTFDTLPLTESSELRLQMPDGREKFVLTRVELRRDEKDRPVGVLGSVHDITERRQAEARVRFLATHDEMTGLPNRLMFNELLDHAVSSAQRYGLRGAVLFIDLNDFKYINDSMGHAAGDDLLRAVGKRLTKVIRHSDCAARLGGDEFCVLAGRISDEHDASALAEKCFAAISEPVEILGRELRPRASIGITVFPDDGVDSQTLMKAADSAMYAAKTDRQHRYRFYSRELTEKAERRMALEHDLRRSLNGGDFLLHYQPQIDLVSGRMTSVEALLRWNHPVRGMVPPGEFIDIAEKTGLIEELGEWALATACRDAKRWNRGRDRPIRVAVNVSSQHFRDGRIERSVARTLEQTGLDPDQLEIEVTETVMQASDENITTFRRLQELGVHIAIDDFGTGYSCLGSLRQLPIDTLKIDQSFIHDLVQSPELPAIIGTIIAMGRAMNLKVIAEGVETLAQTQYLYALDCEMAQGFFFSKPVPSDRIVELLDFDFTDGIDAGPALRTSFI